MNQHRYWFTDLEQYTNHNCRLQITFTVYNSKTQITQDKHRGQWTVFPGFLGMTWIPPDQWVRSGQVPFVSCSSRRGLKTETLFFLIQSWLSGHSSVIHPESVNCTDCVLCTCMCIDMEGGVQVWICKWKSSSEWIYGQIVRDTLQQHTKSSGGYGGDFRSWNAGLSGILYPISSMFGQMHSCKLCLRNLTQVERSLVPDALWPEVKNSVCFCKGSLSLFSIWR